MKEQLTVRPDADVLQWLKAHGRGYQTRINCILRAAMEGQATGKSSQAAKKSDRAHTRAKTA